jgi:NAD(P)-dependent dehydrogenase (short-subunit alcohol dehydrogenase family)
MCVGGDSMFSIQGKIIAVTGGAGVLGDSICKGLASRGAKIAILDFNFEGAQKLANDIISAGGKAVAVRCNVLEKPSVEAALKACIDAFGRVDVLLNAAGGNKPDATCKLPERTFFDLPETAFQWVSNLNFMGTVIPSQVFGKHLADRGEGSILNVSSMNAFRPLTNIAAYSAAKAAVSNFTQWLAVYLALNHSKKIRVNAIAPGFFLTAQNRFLLTDEKTGELTARGKAVVGHTPMGRFGDPDELLGTVVWLLSDAARFVTGVVVPIDGGFNAYSGV